MVTIRQIAEAPRKSLIDLEKELGVEPGTILQEMAGLAEQAGDWSQHVPFDAAVAYNEDPAVHGQYQSHVDGCGYCKRMLETLHPSKLESEIFARRAAQVQPRKRRRMVPAYWVPTTGIATAAVGVVLTWFTFSNRTIFAGYTGHSDHDTPALTHELRTQPEILIQLERSKDPAERYEAARVYFAADKPDLAWRQVGAGLALSGSVDAGDAEKITTAAYVPTHESADALSAAARRLHSIDAEMDKTDQEEKDPTVYLERAEVQAKLGFNREALKSLQQYLKAAKVDPKTLTDFSKLTDHKAATAIASNETNGTDPY